MKDYLKLYSQLLDKIDSMNMKNENQFLELEKFTEQYIQNKEDVKGFFKLLGKEEKS